MYCSSSLHLMSAEVIIYKMVPLKKWLDFAVIPVFQVSPNQMGGRLPVADRALEVWSFIKNLLGSGKDRRIEIEKT